MIKLENLKVIRKFKGLTREELGNKSGVSPFCIQSLEDGRTDVNNVKLSTLVKLADALNCSATELLPKELWKKFRYIKILK